MLAVVAAIVFGVAIFFKVTTIEVQGNTLYSAEDVIAASGIEPGDNLLLVNKATTAGNIRGAAVCGRGADRALAARHGGHPDPGERGEHCRADRREYYVACQQPGQSIGEGGRRTAGGTAADPRREREGPRRRG